ncbi:hypothetical protein M2281_000176 [Mesorhizobium soli]|uniref:DUF6950 family protein n=1 Tax=Pseudaminobacter soli (ex Li et al. 2025) TaxID=1295366 RepID=UPI002475F0FC|nr:hypothetical protein [Mesorhizobium soli]MDH6229604.1 hypothetical protein [Mesorhizobium soli]
MTVEEFIAAEAAKPFAWGETDCASTADRWVEQVRGFSPMALFGRRHRTRDEAMAWLAEPGGIMIAFCQVMRMSGLRQIFSPQLGDVGMAILDRRACIAIHAGHCWFSRHEDGLVGVPLNNVWRAWEVMPRC